MPRLHACSHLLSREAILSRLPQHTLWLQVLQLRLKLQPAMTAAARWPAAAESPLWAGSAALRHAAAEAEAEAGGLLSDMWTLLQALGEKDAGAPRWVGLVCAAERGA